MGGKIGVMSVAEAVKQGVVCCADRKKVYLCGNGKEMTEFLRE